MNIWLYLIGVLLSGSWSSFGTEAHDISAQRKSALEKRLHDLEHRRDQLESIPGSDSLEQQKRYQRQIDRLRVLLGKEVTPFSTVASSHLPSMLKKPSVSTVESAAEEIDFFHNPHQVEEVI